MEKENLRNSKLGIEKFKKSSFPEDDIDLILDNKINNLLFDDPKSSMKSVYVKVGAFSLLAISLVLLAFYLLKAKDVSVEQMFASNFEVFDDMISLSERGEGDVAHSLSHAMDLYSDSKFSEAIPLFRGHLELNNDELVQFYLAVSYLAVNDSRGEVILQEKYDSSVKSEFADAEIWYLALAKLQTEKLEEARKLFQIIANNPKHYKRNEAFGILDILDK